MPLVNLLHYANIFYDGSRQDDQLARIEASSTFPPGQYALAGARDDGWLLARDPLGCNKLFYGRGNSGDLVVASRIDAALTTGLRLDDLASCPPGALLHVTKSDVTVRARHDLLAGHKVSDADGLDRFRGCVRDRLDAAFIALKAAFSDARFVVCLSGGLDSALIAALASRHLDNLSAATFSLVGSEDSEECRAATAAADVLGLRKTAVLRAPAAILRALDKALPACQDWRDFNVHCASVNLALAQDVAADAAGRLTVVLTGDLMNEFVCDYSEEQVDDVTYYPQPRVGTAHRRRFLVRGLDTSDREIGPFAAHGLIVAQPYAAAADCYMALAPGLLEGAGAKQRINGPLLPPEVLACVTARKTRAQVGGMEGGVLGVFHRGGVDQAALKALWAAQFSRDARGDDPWDIIHVGGFRTHPRGH